MSYAKTVAALNDRCLAVTSGGYEVGNDPTSNNRYRVWTRPISGESAIVVMSGLRSVIEAWIDGYARGVNRG